MHRFNDNKYEFLGAHLLCRRDGKLPWAPSAFVRRPLRWETGRLVRRILRIPVHQILRTRERERERERVGLNFVRWRTLSAALPSVSTASMIFCSAACVTLMPMTWKMVSTVDVEMLPVFWLSKLSKILRNTVRRKMIAMPIGLWYLRSGEVSRVVLTQLLILI